MPEPALRQPKNFDVQCLRCNAINIPENKICGRCGASLPLLYDEEGKVFDWKEDAYYKAVYLKKSGSQRFSTERVRWILRAGVILFAIVAAIFIIHRR